MRTPATTCRACARRRGAVELRATGMPLGLMPEMEYDEKEAVLEPGECLLLYSDGLVEAHDPSGEMFGFPRLRELMGRLDRLDLPGRRAARRARPLHRLGLGAGGRHHARGARAGAAAGDRREDGTARCWPRSSWRAFPATSGRPWKGWPPQWRDSHVAAPTLDRLRTAVSEAAMNAIEHGNEATTRAACCGRGARRQRTAPCADHGSAAATRPIEPAERPDLEAKLEGLQKPRGWGLFLIEHMADGMDSWTEGERHTVELTFRLRGDEDADESL